MNSPRIFIATLVPQFEADCPAALRAEIEAHMRTIQARRGEAFEVSTCGQTVMLGTKATP